MIRGAFGNHYKGAQSAWEVSLVLGFDSVALVQGLAPVAWDKPQQVTGGKEEKPRGSSENELARHSLWLFVLELTLLFWLSSDQTT